MLHILIVRVAHLDLAKGLVCVNSSHWSDGLDDLASLIAALIKQSRNWKGLSFCIESVGVLDCPLEKITEIVKSTTLSKLKERLSFKPVLSDALVNDSQIIVYQEQVFEDLARSWLLTDILLDFKKTKDFCHLFQDLSQEDSHLLAHFRHVPVLLSVSWRIGR